MPVLASQHAPDFAANWSKMKPGFSKSAADERFTLRSLPHKKSSQMLQMVFDPYRTHS